MKRIRLITLFSIIILSLSLTTVSLGINTINSPNAAPDADTGKLVAGTGKFVSDSGSNGMDDIYNIFVTSNTNNLIVNNLPFSGATFNPITNRVLFTSSGAHADGSNLYALNPADNTYTLLGIVHTAAGEVRVDGLAMSGGVLYGDIGITSPNAAAGLYSIDQTTFLATFLGSFPDTAISGIDADPVTGKIYGVHDGITSLVEIALNGTITPIAAYPPGETDIDGLAISPGQKAYLIPDQTGSIYVYNLLTGSYEAPLTTPWTGEDYFSAGAFVPTLSNGDILSGNQAKSGKPGTVVSYTVQITNISPSAADTFNISVSSTWTAVPSATSIPLAAGASTTFTVTVTVPSNAVVGAQSIATITATSQNDVSKSDTTQLTTTALAAYGVDLQANQAKSGKPGTVVSYTVQITNTSPSAADTFNISVASTWTAVPSATTIPLAAGASTTFTVQVTVPSNAAVGAQSIATVTATSQNDATATDSTQLTTTALAAYGVDLQANQAKSGKPGTVVSYTIQITNTSPNAADTFNISVSSSWTATPSTTTIPLAAGASTTFTVQVTVPLNATEGAIDVATISATSQHDATATDTSQLSTKCMYYKLYLPIIGK